MKLLAHGARPRFLLPLGSRSVWGSCTARRESATEWMNRTVHANTLTHTLTQTTTTTHTHTPRSNTAWFVVRRRGSGSWSGDAGVPEVFPRLKVDNERSAARLEERC